MSEELENENEHEHEHEHDLVEEGLEQALELDTQSQIFLEMRRQNLDLLKLSIEVAGLGGQHPPIKSGDLKNAVKNIWDLYSEFYSWIDPEESEDDEEDEDFEELSGLADARDLETVGWVGDASTGHVRLIDQTLLPGDFVQIDCRDVPTVWEAIKSLRVRGAPAIGIAAAFGAVIGGQPAVGKGVEAVRSAVKAAGDHLRTSRPTAVNLFWALDRIDRVAAPEATADAVAFLDRLLAEGLAIAEEDKAMCRSIGQFGADLIKPGQGVLTHCNAGGLATADYGTALAVIFAASERGTDLRVFADETRPLLQGARLTAWELQRRGIPVTLICDNMAAQVMKERKVNLVVVGADRIAANGDTANKIGTYGVALLAKAHGIPFYVAAPSSTFDLTLEDGSSIPIEQRDPREVTHGFGRATAPEGVEVYNPAFDVTPADLIAGIITERGIIRPVDAPTIARVLGISQPVVKDYRLV